MYKRILKKYATTVRVVFVGCETAACQLSRWIILLALIMSKACEIWHGNRSLTCLHGTCKLCVDELAPANMTCVKLQGYLRHLM